MDFLAQASKKRQFLVQNGFFLAKIDSFLAKKWLKFEVFSY
jgi:hypothetical protein